MVGTARVTLLVTTFCLSATTAEASDLTNDTVEEGSGLSDDLLWSSSSSSSSGGPSLVKTISKRAAEYYNGVVESKFYWPFTAQKPTFPPMAVMGMGRPLQRGGEFPRTEYVVLWTPRGGFPHWGTVYFDQKLQVEGTFVDGTSVVNISSMASPPTRLLQYVGSPATNNFKFQWVLAKDADPSTVLVQKKSGLCNPRLAPAVFHDEGYEFLGEADIDNRVMRYVFRSTVHIVDAAHFTNNVYLLTKQRCSCSCD